MSYFQTVLLNFQSTFTISKSVFQKKKRHRKANSFLKIVQNLNYNFINKIIRKKINIIIINCEKPRLN